MKITIEYESSWRNSFLDGSNDEPLPKNGRNYIAASANLNDRNKPNAHKVSGLKNNTIFGVLNRLIGDQRKLYQAQQSENYYFKELESAISYIDNPKKLVCWEELVYLRNMSGSFEKEGYVGSINTNHWLVDSSFSQKLWTIPLLNLKEVVEFVDCGELKTKDFEFDPRNIIKCFSEFKQVSLNKLEELGLTKVQINLIIEKLNEQCLNEKMRELFPSMKKTFEDIEYVKNEKLDVRAIYCSSLYLVLLKASEKGANVPSNIKGFSVAGITPKDFMTCFTKGKKRVYGNPYLKKMKIKGEGEVISMLTKASGQLEVLINVHRSKAKEIKNLIDNAGVSSFYLGKKGLAYVSKISTKEES